MKNCPKCGRKAIAVKRVGGWTADCYYADPWNAAKDKEPLCDMFMGSLFFEDEEDAKTAWNMAKRGITECA